MKYMPVHPEDAKKTNVKSVPFSFLNAQKAKEFHGQTLEKLAERGGMSISEILYNVTKMDKRIMRINLIPETIALFEKLVKDHVNPS
jgi:hypothetical protein